MFFNEKGTPGGICLSPEIDALITAIAAAGCIDDKDALAAGFIRGVEEWAEGKSTKQLFEDQFCPSKGILLNKERLGDKVRCQD